MITTILIVLACIFYTSQSCVVGPIPSGCLVMDVNNTKRAGYYCSCLNCNTGLRMAGDRNTCCQQNTTNCQTCNSNLTCITCVGTYGINGTQCVKCDSVFPNCNTCFSVKTVCQNCYGSYALNASLCVACYLFMPYCLQCYSSRSYCYRCNSTIYAVNYRQIPSRCQFCNVTMVNCVRCDTIVYCISCISNLFVLNGTSLGRMDCYPCGNFMEGCYNCSGRSVCHSCLNNSFVYNKNRRLCPRCNATMQYCEICSNESFCLRCTDNRYALVSMLNITSIVICRECTILMMDCLYCLSPTSCKVCSNGRAVDTGCTSIVGCLVVDSKVAIFKNCISCDHISFVGIPVNNTCICIKGWVVGQYCTTIVGCTGLRPINNQAVCVSCNYTAHFRLENNTCVCRQYYYFNNSIQQCREICGDGHLFYLQCDDGNLVNGDGCSSRCQLEQSFTCYNDKSANPATRCKFKGRVKLSLNGIHKVAGQNQINIIFDVSPYNDVFLKMDIADSVVFSSNGSSLVSSSFTSRQLIVRIAYLQNIQGNSANINVYFDSAYVLSPNFVLTFDMVDSSGISLTHSDSSGGTNKGYGKIMTFLGTYSIILLLLGSLAFRMIGVQTVLTIQIVLLIQASSQYFGSLYSIFSKLQISLGQLSILSQQEIGYKTFYSKLGYKSSLKEDYQIIAFINGILIVAYSILKILWKYHQQVLYTLMKQSNKNDLRQISIDQLKNKIEKISCYCQIVYNWGVFPILIGFYYHSFNTNITHIFSGNDDEASFNILLIIVSCSAISVIFFSQIKVLLISRIQPHEQLLKQNRVNYCSLFLVYSMTAYILIYGVALQFIPFGQFVLAGFFGISLVFIISFRPYEHTFHNISLVINQVSILFAVVWPILTEQGLLSSEIEAILMYVFVGDMIIIELFASIRIGLQFKSIYQSYQANRAKQIQQAKKGKREQLINKSINIQELIQKDLNFIQRYNESMVKAYPIISQPFRSLQDKPSLKSSKAIQQYRKKLRKQKQNSL